MVEETGAALLGNGDNSDLRAIGSDQHVTEDNSRGSDELAVSIDVVVGGEGDGLVGRGGGDVDKGGDGSVVLVAEHVDLGVGVVTNEDAVADREISHGLLHAGLDGVESLKYRKSK
jgi:hypothetical protein